MKLKMSARSGNQDDFESPIENINASYAYSDNDHYHKEGKRQNLINFFLQGMEADKYIQANLYGEVKKYDDSLG